MVTDAETIATIKSNALARIAEITADPRPTYTRDGRTYQWTEYLDQLQKTVAWCDQQTVAVDPFEIASSAYT